MINLNKCSSDAFYELDEPQTEDELQKIVVKYFFRFIVPKHENAILKVNPFSGMRETNQTKLSKAKALGWRKAEPDLCFIHRSIYMNQTYAGLALELKKSGVIVFKRNGDISANNHFQEQEKELDKYHQNGFLARFGIGLKESLTIIDSYFKLTKND